LAPAFEGDKAMRIYLATILALGSIASAGAADAACTRHVYNRSANPWTFRATNSSGNVHFTTGLFACKNRTNGPCTVPPHTSVGIEYTTTGGIANGTWYIADKTRQERSFDYRGLASQCPSISHRGNTGAVALNDPADGDINAWGATWANPGKAAAAPHR
jgi:hypothetical protein